jgi:hypothetical protein
VKIFPKPWVGSGSGRFFFQKTQNKNIYEKQVCNVNLAALSVNNLLPFYLKYVLENNQDGQYYKTDKEVWNDLGLSSEDKAQRVRKLAIERGYLVPGFQRTKLLQVQKDKIEEYLKGGLR